MDNQMKQYYFYRRSSESENAVLRDSWTPALYIATLVLWFAVLLEITSIPLWSRWPFYSHTFRAIKRNFFKNKISQPHMECNVYGFFFVHQIAFMPWPPLSDDVSRIKKACSIIVVCLIRYIPPAATLDLLWKYVDAAWIAIPQQQTESRDI